ncbi:MAG TPA: hypothetical protein VLZ54_08325, partial [Arenibacter sp.]|nr:hypothetical protein [Arenibacter sp.]
TAERRTLKNGDKTTQLRLMDFMGVIPSITGKIELVYEGEQEGAGSVAELLIEDAVKFFFARYFPKIDKLERKDVRGPYDELIGWFFEGDGFELLDDASDEEYRNKLDSIPALSDLLRKYQPDFNKKDSYFLKELLLWGLVGHKKLSKQRFVKGYQIKDVYGSFIRGL